MTEIKKLDLASMNITEDQKLQLKKLFPAVFTEGGKVDFERLRLTLGETIDPGKERYGMNWPGKADCFKTIQQPSVATLVPSREESVNFDNTENLIIEGDNLEVLKLLQKSYLGKVKMIYIDPPYNTGNDFIYPDNYAESLETYLRYTGQIDDEGRKYSTNTETDGRFHSRWMTMMYPRLFLARNLLRDDGFIFISIDDHESSNLRCVMNEIFGEENCIGIVAWKKTSGSNDTNFIYVHESIMIYGKSQSAQLGLLPLDEKTKRLYSNPDNDPRGDWASADYTARWTPKERPTLNYPIIHPFSGEKILPQNNRVWNCSTEVHQKNVEEKRLWWGKNGELKVPRYKRFLSESKGGIIPRSLWDDAGTNQDGNEEFWSLGFNKDDFSNPKPTSMIMKILNTATQANTNDLVLDFFAGSGTTAHAVLAQNLKDGGSRRFILVQLPEPTGHAEFPTISEITKERVRRVVKKLTEEETGKLDLDKTKNQDRGFRVFKLKSSNFKTWNAGVGKEPENVSQQLEMHVKHLTPGRDQEDILCEILLKSGFPLSTKLSKLNINGKSVFSVENGSMLICLDAELTESLIKGIADQKPSRVVCLDEGFKGNDSLKTNAVQTMKSKGVEDFRTV